MKNMRNPIVITVVIHVHIIVNTHVLIQYYLDHYLLLNFLKIYLNTHSHVHTHTLFSCKTAHTHMYTYTSYHINAIKISPNRTTENISR